ncbi:oxysterol binding family protein [Stylonychia lemnae]|uniref:Oxysterol binding family protein n=1 Tax=Stylonychia lemnae TaxID=5949 RepID=A0A078AMH6_STYLE|nr:oxysterol binding family protein [Stylonychia lemnae]|eukprot:CDW82058.1 oxysterol binding family protein [Stylonychia lemnae]
MEITIENFEQRLPLIKESIQTAEFIAIDTEFSGFQVSDDDKPHDYDTVEERYQKIKYNVQKYLAFQVGICTFHWIEKDKKYTCRPFCFYVYPRSKIGECSHMMQSFSQLSKLEEIKEKCMKKAQNLLIRQRQISLLSINHQMKLQEMMAQIEEWVYEANSGETLEFQIDSYCLQKALSKYVRNYQSKFRELTKQYISRGVFAEFERNKPRTIIKKTRGFKQRNFLRDVGAVADSQDLSQVVLGFQDDEVIQKDKSKRQKMQKKEKIIELTEEQKIMSQLSQQLTQQAQADTYWNTAQKTEQDIEKDYQDLLNAELGFSRIIQLMIDCKKPLIGHNLMFDICYIYNQFIDNLPSTFNEFKELWLQNFCSTYDTKILSEYTKRFGKSELAYLFQKCKKDRTFKNNVVIELDVNQDSKFGVYNANGTGNTTDDLNGQNHDAAYDAFNTGYIFIAISKYIEIGKVILPSQQANLSQQTDTSKKAKGTSKQKTNEQEDNKVMKSNKSKQPEIIQKGKRQQPSRKVSSHSVFDKEKDIDLSDLLDEEEKELKPINKKLSKKQQQLLQKQNSIQDNDEIIVEVEMNNNSRPKHYFMVQNKPVYYEDLEEFHNKVMLSRDIPRYFHFQGELTEAEKENEMKMASSVMQLSLNDKADLSALGILFSTYGDINIVKVNDYVVYVEFTFFDKAKIKSRDIEELIKTLAKLDKGKKGKMFEKILNYNLGLISLTSLGIYKLFGFFTAKSQEISKFRQEIDDHQIKCQDYNDQFQGITGIFSNETEDDTIYTNILIKKYYLPQGIPNIGNTCYMNSLLQALTGCKLFMDYVRKLWKNITPINSDNDSIIVFKLLVLLLDLSRGNSEVVPDDLYQMMCENFTTHSEQMDSHELLIYLQERITKIAAMHLRNMTYDEGLACPDLISVSTKSSQDLNEKESDIDDNLLISEDVKHGSIFEDSPIRQKEEEDRQNYLMQLKDDVKLSKFISGRLLRGVLQFKELSTNKKLGLNPFAGVYMSTIQCVNCGPDEAIHRWEVFYDLSVDVKKNIYQSLEQFFKSEQIADYTCIKCSLRVYLANQSINQRQINFYIQLSAGVMIWNIKRQQINYKRQRKSMTWMKIYSKILCIHLKRVSYSVTGQMILNSGNIEYPEILDLSKIVIQYMHGQHFHQQRNKCDVANSNSYELTAVIQHFGSAYGGHYIACKKLFPIARQTNKQRSHNSTWVCCDDEKLNYIDSRQIVFEMLKSGNIYKLGEGPINYGWNLRFFVLDELNQDLTYYQNEEEVKPNGTIHLVDALISNITLIKEREHSFSIQTAPPNGKTYFLSCNSQEESNEWRDAIITASTKHKIHMAQASFNNKTGPKDRFNSMGGAINGGPWKKDDDYFDENMLLQDDGNFFDIQKVKRKTETGGLSKNINSLSGFLNSNNSPEQPLRLSKFKRSPQDFTPGSDNFSNESIDERQNPINHKSLGKQKLYNRSKLGAKLDMGQLTQEQAQYLKLVQDMIQEDQGLKPINQAWEAVTVQNGVQIFALNPKSHRLIIDKKQIMSQVKLLGIMMVVLYFLKSVFGIDIDYFYLGILIQILNFKSSNGILTLQRKYGMLKARTLVQGDSEQIGNEILKCYKDNHQDSFDFMTITVKELNRDEDKHVLNTEETLDLPSDYVVRQFLERRSVKMLTYWCQDESGNFYVLRKSHSQSSKSGKVLNNVMEAYICVPIENNKSEKCIVYFFSDFNYGEQGPSIVMNSLLQDKIKVMRMGILASLAQYQKYLNERQIRHVYQVTRDVQQQIVNKNMEIFDGPLLMADLDDDAKFGGRTHSISSNQGDFFNENRQQYRGSVNARIIGEAGGQLKKIKENPRNISVRPGQRIGISDRFPGYFRLETGALWCHNQDELSSQSGIFMEILQTAGKKLMEGRGIVAVSLPVRIFEKRSTVERICDLWCTGPIFLKKAALEALGDPLERMKQVITFVISGMHQVASQRKPFNPIVGETFEGLWPDGSRLYVEHVSHHPPISCFQVENIDGLFTLEGSYEYTARVTDLGNSVTGRQIGKNRVKFQDGSFVEWEYPVMRISGLIFGKRTTTWLGSFEFVDNKNQLRAQLEFSKEGGFFTRQSLPIDCIEGTIQGQGQEVSKIQGSWLEFLRFDDKLYWELETCDTVRPVAIDKCLPSDCRYREDSIAFGEGDLDKAQQEKERLEELQRKDRRLRELAVKRQQRIRFN